MEKQELAVGMRVRILDGSKREGVVYEYCRGRCWPWHVRPDGWQETEAGIAYAAHELGPLTVAEAVESGDEWEGFFVWNNHMPNSCLCPDCAPSEWQ